MKYKMLVLDIDGTLVNAKGIISDRDIDAVRWLSGTGVAVTLSTGRVPKACRGVLYELQLNGHHIFFDGALVADRDLKDVVYSMPIKKSKVISLIDHARSSGTYLEMYTADRFYAEAPNWTDIIHQNFFGVGVEITNLKSVCSHNPVLKMETIARDFHEFEKAGELKSRFGNQFRFSIARSPAFPGIDFVNIIETGVSKGKALSELARHKHILLEEVVAVGDGLNDITLLQTAGLGIAMDNAFDELKEVADEFTASVDEGGVAAVVQRYFS